MIRFAVLLALVACAPPPDPDSVDRATCADLCRPSPPRGVIRSMGKVVCECALSPEAGPVDDAGGTGCRTFCKGRLLRQTSTFWGNDCECAP